MDNWLVVLLGLFVCILSYVVVMMMDKVDKQQEEFAQRDIQSKLDDMDNNYQTRDRAYIDSATGDSILYTKSMEEFNTAIIKKNGEEVARVQLSSSGDDIDISNKSLTDVTKFLRTK